MNLSLRQSFSSNLTPHRFIFVVALTALSLIAACNPTTTTVTESSSNTRTESPIAVYRALYEAARKDDLEGIKSRLSEATLSKFEKKAKDEGITLNDGQKSVDLIKKTLYVPDKMPELSNEKITGDTATIDITNQGGSPVSTPFVKEKGQWKLALDKFF